MPTKFKGFKLRCKVGLEVLSENEDPIEHLKKHELTNYYDLIPVVEYEEKPKPLEKPIPKSKPKVEPKEKIITAGEADLKYAGAKAEEEPEPLEEEEEI